MIKRFYIILLFFLTLVSSSYAQKTDTVNFYNGDRAVCEIKGLEQGKLLIKTVAMGTISVEWRNVSSVVSDKYYEIVLSDHTTFFGAITGVDSMRNAMIKFGIFVEAVPLEEIVKLSPISNNFWTELDGSISMGLNFTKGTDNLQFNSSGNVSYQTIRTVNSFSFNSNISENTATRSEKQDAGYRLQYYHKNRVYNAFDMGWERNTELGVSSRLITTLSVGYNVVNNNYNVLSLEGGGSGNREFTTEDSTLNNLEGLLRIKYDLFIFANPKLFITVQTELFPSFTIKDRLRANLDIKTSWDIFTDFTFSVTFWGNWDTKPINTNALGFDWGTTTSIGYKF
jgi:hypothetical protein